MFINIGNELGHHLVVQETQDFIGKNYGFRFVLFDNSIDYFVGWCSQLWILARPYHSPRVHYSISSNLAFGCRIFLGENTTDPLWESQIHSAIQTAHPNSCFWLLLMGYMDRFHILWGWSWSKIDPRNSPTWSLGTRSQVKFLGPIVKKRWFLASEDVVWYFAEKQL